MGNPRGSDLGIFQQPIIGEKSSGGRQDNSPLSGRDNEQGGNLLILGSKYIAQSDQDKNEQVMDQEITENN